MLGTKIISGLTPSIGCPGGRVTSTDYSKTSTEEKIKIATWNVQTLSQHGKFHNAIKEMKRMNIDILGVSEIRWPQYGDVYVEDHRVLYSGKTNDKHEYGVGIILNKRMAQCLKSFTPISERVMLIQMKSTPVDINIVQVYAPTLDAEDEEIETMYTAISSIMKSLKKHEVTIVMGDFNAKVGEGSTSDLIGPFGLGERNTRGDRLEEFAATNELVVLNTWYKQPPRRLYTWKSPKDKPGDKKPIRNQIDFILMNKRFRNSCLSIRTYPGADINSDHCPLVSVIRVRMKKVKVKKPPPCDLHLLKYQAVKEMARNILNTNIHPELDNSVNAELSKLQQTVEKIKREVLKPDLTKKKSWMTSEILNLMEERRINKGNPTEYKRLQQIIRQEIRKAKEKEVQEKCEEIEYHQSRHDDFNVHKKVREVIGKHHKKICAPLVNETGDIIVDSEKKKETWKIYLEKLFHDVREDQVTEESEGPDILVEEVRAAIDQLKTGKAAGPDKVQAEFLKLLDDEKTKWLTRIFNRIHIYLDRSQQNG